MSRSDESEVVELDLVRQRVTASEEVNRTHSMDGRNSKEKVGGRQPPAECQVAIIARKQKIRERTKEGIEKKDLDVVSRINSDPFGPGPKIGS